MHKSKLKLVAQKRNHSAREYSEASNEIQKATMESITSARGNHKPKSESSQAVREIED